MKDFFKKISKQESEELDTGYNSDYYGSSYPREPVAPARESNPYEREESPYAREYGEGTARTYRPPYSHSVEKVVEPEVKAPTNAGTLYFVPETYKDSREEIVKGLAESHVVVVNVKMLETADMMRLLDYIAGAVLALDADMTRLNATALLLSPKDLEVTEEDLRSLLSGSSAEASEDEAEDESMPTVGMSEDDDEGYDYRDTSDVIY